MKTLQGDTEAWLRRKKNVSGNIEKKWLSNLAEIGDRRAVI